MRLFFVLFVALALESCGQNENNLGSLNMEESSLQKTGDDAIASWATPEAQNFYVLTDGTDLKKYDDSNGKLIPKKGTGKTFGDAEKKKYTTLKNKAGVYWVVRDLHNGKVIAQGKDTDKNVYGASVPKIIVGSAALYKNGGKLKTAYQWKALTRLLVDSENNPAWDENQELAGGQDGVNAFTKHMGYLKMKAARYDGNAVNAIEMSQFHYDILHNRFEGAEVVFKISSACNTGNDRALKYYPTNIYAGGKTGTYNDANHDTRFLRVNGHWYSIVVLTTLGNDENVALMHGGLLREYISK